MSCRVHKRDHELPSPQFMVHPGERDILNSTNHVGTRDLSLGEIDKVQTGLSATFQGVHL